MPLVLLCNYNVKVCFVALPLLLLFFATLSFAEIFECVFFFMAFSSVSPFFTGMLTALVLVTFIRYIVDVKKHKRPVHWLIVLVSSVIFVIFTCVFYEVSIGGFYNWALMTGLLFGGYLIFVYRDEIRIGRAFYFLIAGLIISALASGIVLLTNIQGYEVLPFDGVYNRAKFFTRHTNHLSMFSIFSLTYLAYLFANSKVNQIKDLFLNTKAIVHICLFLCVALIGFLTLSKTFLIMFSGICVYLMIVLVLKLKTKSLYIILPLLAVGVALGFVFADFVEVLIDRFSAYYTSGTLLTQILTNRDQVWIEYFKISTKSIWTILFGVGMLTKGVGFGAHNVLVYLFFRIGVVGLLLSTLLVWLYAKQVKTKTKITFFNFLPLFVFVILSMIEMTLSDRFFLFLVVGLLLLFAKTENQPTENDKNF